MNEQLEIPVQRHEQLTRLEQTAQWRLRGYVRELWLVFCADGVILRGRACSYYAKQLAQHAVQVTTELPILANEIEVSRPRVADTSVAQHPGGVTRTNYRGAIA